MQDITIETFQEKVSKLSWQKPVLIDFWAPWCGPCRAVSPIVEEIAAENTEKVEVVKINIDEEPELARKFDIMSIPALVLFEKGEEVTGYIGSGSKADILAYFEEYL